MRAEACCRWARTPRVSPHVRVRCGGWARAPLESHANGLGLEVKKSQTARFRPVHGTELTEDDLSVSGEQSQVFWVLQPADHVNFARVLAVHDVRITGRATDEGEEGAGQKTRDGGSLPSSGYRSLADDSRRSVRENWRTAGVSRRTRRVVRRAVRRASSMHGFASGCQE